MATRPTVGGSDGTWGTELNAHLDVSLDADGKVDDGAAQTTSAAPGADAEIANKKYIDDQITAMLAASVTIGTTALDDDNSDAMVAAHAYLCNQDGVVEVIITEGGNPVEVIGYDDSDSNPASGGNVRAHFETDHYGAATVNKSFNFLMASGRYFEIVTTSATVTIRWIPFGTLVKCTDQD